MIQSYVPPTGPGPSGPYSTAVRAGDFVFVSSVSPIDPVTGTPAEGGAYPQTQRALLNLAAALQAARAKPEDVAKVTLYLRDIGDLEGVDKAFAQFFGEPLPTRSVVQTALPEGHLVAVDCIAHTGT